MFKGSDDKKVCNSILENVKSQKANILALGGYNTIEKKRDMALKRSKILHELYDGLYGLYEIMDKYNMRVWRSSKSTLPSVVQSSRNR